MGEEGEGRGGAGGGAEGQDQGAVLRAKGRLGRWGRKDGGSRPGGGEVKGRP